MKLYFQAGEKKRIAIDTERKVWNDNYFHLGAHHMYIKISVKDYWRLISEIDFNAWDYEEQFNGGVKYEML